MFQLLAVVIYGSHRFNISQGGLVNLGGVLDGLGELT